MESFKHNNKDLTYDAFLARIKLGACNGLRPHHGNLDLGTAAMSEGVHLFMYV